MRAGQLRHRVAVQKAVETQSSSGEITVEWQILNWTWAAIMPLEGREFDAANQVKSESSHEIRLRYDSSLTSEHRILYGTRVFEINAVLNVDERDREMRLLAREVAA